MKKNQAKGYILESIIWKLLKRYGYIDVTTSKLRGRGASHQIDAHGILAIPTPFIYPVRLICEAKYYKDAIKLHNIRNFVGIMKDISENYIVGKQGERNTPYRYTDSGCFFSASPYEISAQEYAWAHNIFLISFNNIPLLLNITNVIDKFVDQYPNDDLDISAKDLRKKFWHLYKYEEIFKQSSMIVGILDKIYPIVLVGKGDWINIIDRELPLGREIIEGVKSNRFDTEYETRFDLKIMGQQVYFVLPTIVAYKIITRIKNAEKGNDIFKIDIPFITRRDNNEIRRFFKIIITLPGEDRKSYFKNLQATVNVVKPKRN